MTKGLAVLVVVGSALVVEPAFAIPAFARRYKVECHFCHEGFPKLNGVGQRFKERGLRMEREDDFDATKWVSSLPATIRGEYNHGFQESGDGSNFGYLKGISAGNLGKRFSYWVDDAVLIQEGDDSFVHIKPDNAWLRVQVAHGNRLYAKGGRLELDIPFTLARAPHLFGYEIYFANTGAETDGIAAHHEGVELGGDAGEHGHWSAALVGARHSEQSKQLSSDVGGFDPAGFLRYAQRIGGHRVGGFAYLGRNTLALVRGTPFKDDLLRLGVDADVWIDRLNLYGLYMYGRNSNSTGTNTSATFSGGFAQADLHLLEPLALTLRLNVVNKPTSSLASKDTFSSLFPGIQVFIFEHGKLSFEYGFLNKERKSFGAIQAEFAF